MYISYTGNDNVMYVANVGNANNFAISMNSL